MNILEHECIVSPGGIYRHFKGSLYEVIGVAKHSENGENMVVYRSLNTGDMYVRPIDMFTSDVDKDKYPNVKQKCRFQLECLPD